MIRLLLLLLVGTIYAQERDDYDYGDVEKTAVQDGDSEEIAVQGDLEETGCPGSQEDGGDMADDLQTSDLSHCHNVTMESKHGICPDKGTCSYRVFNVLRTFGMARRACRCRRGNLSSIHNMCANNQVRCLAKRTCTNRNLVWIGVVKPKGRVGYRNVDGSCLNFTNWGCGQFRRKGRWCTALNLSTGQWFSLRCKTRLPFVCTI